MNIQQEQKQLSRYRDRILSLLALRNGCSVEEAEIMIRDSAFDEIMEVDPEMIFHYSVKYWVEDIMEQLESSLMLN